MEEIKIKVSGGDTVEFANGDVRGVIDIVGIYILTNTGEWYYAKDVVKQISKGRYVG